ncbi:hypothetical protein STEG23_029932 [Scotinomys teguina]
MCRAAEAQHSSPGGGAGARLEEAAALQLRGVGAAASEAEAAVVALAETPAPQLGKALGRDPREGPMEVAAAGGGCGAGPPLLLSDSEQQCYSELFARCAGAASGGPGPGPPEATRVAPSTATAAAGPVADLFRASQLPPETLHQPSQMAAVRGEGKRVRTDYGTLEQVPAACWAYFLCSPCESP